MTWSQVSRIAFFRVSTKKRRRKFQCPTWKVLSCFIQLYRYQVPVYLETAGYLFQFTRYISVDLVIRKIATFRLFRCYFDTSDWLYIYEFYLGTTSNPQGFWFAGGGVFFHVLFFATTRRGTMKNFCSYRTTRIMPRSGQMVLDRFLYPDFWDNHWTKRSEMPNLGGGNSNIFGCLTKRDCTILRLFQHTFGTHP